MKLQICALAASCVLLTTPAFALPPTTPITYVNATDFITPPLLFDGNRMLLQASLGQINANASGHINVWIDDFVGSPTANRSWYDGLGYALAIPEPAPLSPVASAILALALRRNT